MKEAVFEEKIDPTRKTVTKSMILTKNFTSEERNFKIAIKFQNHFKIIFVKFFPRRNFSKIYFFHAQTKNWE